MTLDEVMRGARIKILDIPDQQARAQAIRFGISVGSEVVCIEKIFAGPIVLSRSKQEIAIGRQLAKRIQVELM